MKPISLALAAGALAMAGCSSNDDDMMPPPVGATAMPYSAAVLSSSARNYAMMTASSNMFEIEKSRLALQRSQNPTLRDFAQRMIDDHTMLMNQAVPVFSSMGLDPASMQMTSAHRQLFQQLQSAPAADFDRMYHQIQTNAHQEALNLQRGYAQSGDNPELRALAAQAAPVIESHLDMLRDHRMHMMPDQRRAGERG